MLHILALVVLAGGLVVARVVLPVLLAAAEAVPAPQTARGGRALRVAPLGALLVVIGAAALATLT